MKIHIVRPGDTMNELVQRYNIPLERLLEANPHLEQPEELQVGTKVRIPSGRIFVAPKRLENFESQEDWNQPTSEPEYREATILHPTYLEPMQLKIKKYLEAKEYLAKQGSKKEEFVQDWDEEWEDESSSSYGNASSYPFYPYHGENELFDPSFYENSFVSGYQLGFDSMMMPFPPYYPAYNPENDLQYHVYSERLEQSNHGDLNYSFDFQVERVFEKESSSAEY